MSRLVGAQYLERMGWEVEGQAPDLTHFVLIAAPHTSNWDFPLMMSMASVLGLKIAWMGKHTLFQPPFGTLLRRMGGVPIERHRRSNMVDQMVERMASTDRLALTIPAEGTRGRLPYWKSGFYHIAKKAEVPVVLSYLDYGRKIGGIGPTVHLSGDVRADMDIIRAFYADKQAKHPAKFSPIRLREEDLPEEEPAALAS